MPPHSRFFGDPADVLVVPPLSSPVELLVDAISGRERLFPASDAAGTTSPSLNPSGTSWLAWSVAGLAIVALVGSGFSLAMFSTLNRRQMIAVAEHQRLAAELQATLQTARISEEKALVNERKAQAVLAAFEKSKETGGGMMKMMAIAQTASQTAYHELQAAKETLAKAEAELKATKDQLRESAEAALAAEKTARQKEQELLAKITDLERQLAELKSKGPER